MASEETKTILALLVQLAKADGVVDIKEDLFIKLYAHNNAMDPGEFERICLSPDMYARNLSSITDKEEIFVQLCSFIHFDMSAVETELAWCQKVGMHLDLGSAVVEQTINAIRESKSPMSLNQLTELIKT